MKINYLLNYTYDLNLYLFKRNIIMSYAGEVCIHLFTHSLYLYTVTCSKNLFFHTSVVKTINIKTRLKDR